MGTLVLQFFSHLFFIYLVHSLLWQALDWGRLLGEKIRQPRAFQLLLLFVAIALGYLASNFFLGIITLGQSMAELFRQ